MSQDKDQGKTGEKPPQIRANLLVAVGSNMSSDLGSPAESLKFAIKRVADAGAVIRAQSRFFRTPAVPAGSGPDFVNGALALEAAWSAPEAMSVLHGIEAAMGRRRTVRWGQRVVDLDLLAYDHVVRPDVATLRTWMDLTLDEQMSQAPGQLILPHPRMHQRAFVLTPLAEVAPDWVHPVLRRTVVQMRDALPDDARAGIAPLE
ncbi:MAG: 2-amino-4-hydroxy-6-hydroxymethyldihydropteridine diphosphokinase [Pseudomonadota bacterium]